MKIIICIKQVPDTDKVEMNLKTRTLIREGASCIINPEDKNALEEALRLKEQCNAHLTALTLGPLQAKEALKEALAMGVDEGILLSDKAFTGSDTWASAIILSAAIEKIGDYDIVLCGNKTTDGGTGHVGPKIAEFLNLPLVTQVKEVKLKKDQLEVVSLIKYDEYTFKTPMPVLLTVIKELNVPRQPTMKNIIQAYAKKSEEKIKVWKMDDMNVDQTQIGLEGSPTQIYKTFSPVENSMVEIIKGKEVKDQAKNLVKKLSKLNII